MIGVHVSPSMAEMARLTSAVSRTVTDTSAPAFRAAAMVGCPMNAESARNSTFPTAPVERILETVFNTSATRRLEPRGEPTASLRSR